ncbi:MAG: TRIC cation channel family protein [Saprospiraceae bacterium]|nr:TRIC cation channel family protein [Saprospiraceae bacterium]
MKLLALILGYAFRSHITKFRKGLFLFDTIGMELFTILGLQKTLNVGLSPGIAVMMGTVSAIFGGVIRDVLTDVTLLIFRAKIYATVCLAFSTVLNFFYEIINVVMSMITVFDIRLFAVKRNNR